MWRGNNWRVFFLATIWCDVWVEAFLVTAWIGVARRGGVLPGVTWATYGSPGAVTCFFLSFLVVLLFPLLTSSLFLLVLFSVLRVFLLWVSIFGLCYLFSHSSIFSGGLALFELVVIISCLALECFIPSVYFALFLFYHCSWRCSAGAVFCIQSHLFRMLL